MLRCLNAKMTEKGFAALFFAILILALIFAIGMSVALLTLGQQAIAANITKSTQAYFTAEAGIEDALLRLAKSKNWSSPYVFSVGDSSVNVEISEIIGGARTIIGTGDYSNRIRKVRVVYEISSEDVSFHYGVQVGDLGLQMDSNTRVHGNVFSNGPIVGSSNSKISGDAISARPGGRIEIIEIDDSEGGGNAWAATIAGGSQCKIDSDAHYVPSVGSIDCDTVGGSIIQEATSVEPQDMPMTQEQIDGWKVDAAAGGTIAGYSLGGNDEDSLGPVKVDGDMTLDSNAELTITGTIWVTGNLSLNSNVKVQIDPNYSNFSGIILVDGQVFVDSNIILCGSEGFKEAQNECYPSIGSYLMLLSTNISADPNNPAIYSTSNTKTTILYASAGFIKLGSNANLREVIGYGIVMESNVEVSYEIGLADAKFSSGPGGTWEVKSWKEIE